MSWSRQGRCLAVWWCVQIFVAAASSAGSDWLVARISTISTVAEHVCWGARGPNQLCGLEISNGLISRRFVLAPAFGTVDFLMNTTDVRGGEQSMFRAIEPEATIVLNGTEYQVGGLRSTDTFRAYCNRSKLKRSLIAAPQQWDKTTFRYVSHTVGTPVAPFPWTPGNRHGIKSDWPPKGVTLSVVFETKADVPLRVIMHYECYDGIPVLSKWMDITSTNAGPEVDTIISSVTVEQFAAMPRFGSYIPEGSRAPNADDEGASHAGTTAPVPLLHVKSDQAHGVLCEWVNDYLSSNDSHVSPLTPHDQGAAESKLNCSYTIGPGAHVNKQESFVSFRVLMLATDTTEETRQMLMRQRMMQVLAPHTTENPIFFHATSVDEVGFRNAIDQMAEVGFEMLIFSFGTDFHLETANTTYLQTIKRQVDYANSKGIEVGGYDLICLDRGHGGYGGNVGDQWVTVDATTGALKANACFASGWYDKLKGLVANFLRVTGLSMLETDGPYGGDDCASHNHSHHHGEEDSVYRQTQLQNQFYHDMRQLGVYVNQPDNYFLQGGSRSGMGYDENQYSLPRWEDISISRMGMYDDLYSFLPTQGWMFVPLVEYHGGGAAASFDNHFEEFEWAVAQYLGAGTAACYRGDQLYNQSSPTGLKTKEMLIKWVSFYKAHRETIIQPVVHLRRPNMQSWDGWMHVNPFPGEKNEVAVAMIFNPTDFDFTKTAVVLPLYYTGLDDVALVSIDGADAVALPLARDYTVKFTLDMPPRSIHTVVLARQ